jgi:hypothetical protein
VVRNLVAAQSKLYCGVEAACLSYQAAIRVRIAKIKLALVMLFPKACVEPLLT